jgi:hypothetical protein
MERWLRGLKHWFAKSTYILYTMGSNPILSKIYLGYKRFKARLVELVDTSDLKSDSFRVSVQVR